MGPIWGTKRTQLFNKFLFFLCYSKIDCHFDNSPVVVTTRIQLSPVQTKRSYEVRHKKETNPIAWEPRVGGERQTDGYRTCSDLSQCYKAQLDRFIQYKWTHLQK
jgi:hypothetical protein